MRGTFYHRRELHSIAHGERSSPRMQKLESQGHIFYPVQDGTQEGKWLKWDEASGIPVSDTERIEAWANKRERRTPRHQQFDALKLDFRTYMQNPTPNDAQTVDAVRAIIRILGVLHPQLELPADPQNIDR